MATVRVPLCRPDVGQAELDAVAKVFSTGALSHGPAIAEFENAFARRIGVRCAVAMNSCTSALYLACLYVRERIGEGEIIVPSFTFVASANAIVCSGMSARLVDVEWETAEVSTRTIEPAINDCTRAIMVVHYAGLPCPMVEVMSLAAKYGLVVIEDSAECLGASVAGKQVGSFGWGVFSFYSTKNITTGEGGMVTTDDDELAGWLRLRLAHGVSKGSYSRDSVSRRWHRNAVVAGYNFRLSNFQAAMGLAQLNKLDEMNARRYAVAEQYYAGLKNVSGVECPEHRPPGAHSYQMYPIKVRPEVRDKALVYLNERGVEASAHFDPPIHWQSAYSQQKISLPVTERLARATITLPISAVQTREQTQYVLDNLCDALQP
jgi:perosamine synthetase